MPRPREPRFPTQCVHAGQSPDPATGAIVAPIYQTSTFVQEGVGRHKGYEYARSSNPTRGALERHLAALEGGARGVAFASGMAAVNAVAGLLAPGDHVLVTEAGYGGTYRLFEQLLAPGGLTFEYVDTTRPENVERALRDHTRLVFVESPTNPGLQLADLAALSTIAHARGARVVVDNTFASPCLQRPLALGADIVLHSTTKYLNGHSDGIGGIVVTASQEDGERLAHIQNAAGAILGPFDAWLVLRGTKTLALRMAQHCTNARALARFLDEHPKVGPVYYPGLPAHPQHDLARRQMNDFGGMLAFDLGSREAVEQMLGRLTLIALAESLGGVESLISYPAAMSHAAMTPERRAHIGVTDGLVRLSVGIEDVDDLRDDLARALEAV